MSQKPHTPKNKKHSRGLALGLCGVAAACLLFAGGAVVGNMAFGGHANSDSGASASTSDSAPTLQINSKPESDSSNSSDNYDTADGMAGEDIYKKVNPSVVSVISTTAEGTGSGSGVIMSKDGYIITNNHVVEDSTSLKVAFIDSEVVDAAIKGTDAETDLAVIAVPLEQIKDDTKSKIKVARLGNSDELKVGQGVVAIGNALGYGQSVTVGYVSALNREVRVSNTSTRELLQTDAAINPGNSGGALLNMRGEVIGINAAKYSSTEVEGIGYAIPISKAEDIMNQLMNRKTMNPVEEAKRGYLGIQGTSVDEESAAAFGMPRGVYVYKILEEGAAARSDLREKDIITKVDGQSVRNMTDLQELLACYEMGEQIDLTVQSQKDGEYQERTVTITLKAMPQENTETQAQ